MEILQGCHVFVFLFLFTKLHNHVVVEAQDLRAACTGGNYTANSAYQRNLQSLLGSLPSNLGDFGFYNSSLGEAPDRVNLAALCRVDVLPEACQSCLSTAIREIGRSCPMSRGVIVYQNLCTLRFTNQSIFGTYDDRTTGWTFWDLSNVTSIELFNGDLNRLITGLRNYAAEGGPLIKAAGGNVTGPDFYMIYSLVQCTPDISTESCRSCLEYATRQIQPCCSGSTGVRMYYPNCAVIYSTTSFYNSTRIQEVEAMATGSHPQAPPSPAPSAPPQSPPSPALLAPSPSPPPGSSTKIIIIVVIVGVAACTLLVGVVIIILKRRKKKNTNEYSAAPRHGAEDDEMQISTPLQREFDEMRIATDDFSEANTLGRGGFGAVYKGRLKNGQEIAVKRLFTGPSQGDADFKNEVMAVARLQHRNLVRLFGFAIGGPERLLIFEYFKKGSLEKFIFGADRGSLIAWDGRYNIVRGIAKGLQYLHEDSRLRVIHRDLKAANILLDDDLNPKIADFGLAKLVESDATKGTTFKIVGTPGYMAPEYREHGRFSVKTDVYSFGVLVLEIVSGRKRSSFKSSESAEDMLSFTWRKWAEGTAEGLIDPMLMAGPSQVESIMKCIHIALLCVQENADRRPTMSEVVLMLGSSHVAMPDPPPPAAPTPSTSVSGSQQQNFSSRNEEVSHSSMDPR